MSDAESPDSHGPAPTTLLVALARRGGGSRRRRSPFSRSLTFLLLLLALVLLPFAWAWPFSGVSFPADLLAQFAAQTLLAALALTLLALLLRRFLCAGLAAASILGSALPLLSPRAPQTDPISVHAQGRSPLRVLMCNAFPFNPTPEKTIQQILDSDADVIGLTESSNQLLDLIRSDPRVRERYPYFDLPDAAREGWAMILSRWPQRPFAPEHSAFAYSSGGRPPVIIDRDESPFIFMMLHPHSPRTPRDWTAGNACIEGLVNFMRTQIVEPAVRLPVIIAADLNSSPSGFRSRRINEGTSLLRAKPHFLAQGTFPAHLPWPLRIAIDDVWVSPGVRVASWQTLPFSGSDHAAVLVELDLPTPSSSP